MRQDPRASKIRSLGVVRSSSRARDRPRPDPPSPPLPSSPRTPPAAADKAKEFAIRRVLEQVVLTSMHPRLGVTVVIQIVGDDGAAESCALNAAGLALMDAAVPMRGVLCAATVARTTTTSPRKREDAPLAGDEESGDCGRLIVDPTAGEERVADGALTAAFCFRGGRVGETPPAALPTAEVEVLHAAYRSSGEAIVPRGGGVGFDSGGGEGDGDGGEASTLAFLEATALARDAARGVFECVRASARRFAQRAEAELEAFVQRARALADERAKQRGRPSRAEPARAIGEEERERDEPTTSD